MVKIKFLPGGEGGLGNFSSKTTWSGEKKISEYPLPKMRHKLKITGLENIEVKTTGLKTTKRKKP